MRAISGTLALALLLPCGLRSTGGGVTPLKYRHPPAGHDYQGVRLLNYAVHSMALPQSSHTGYLRI